MKNVLIIALIASSLMLVNCEGSKPVLIKDQAWSERCKGVTALSWQKEIQGADAETTAKIVTEATLAAKADAKTADVNAQVDAGFKSELARVINENVSTSSEVDDEFWKQENTFGRLYCLSVSLLDREDISKEQKEKIVDDIREMQKAEATYILNQKKKAQ
ncbi:MAG: hypothetical protein RIC35_13365 [Marinoscillum sp.]